MYRNDLSVKADFYSVEALLNYEDVIIEVDESQTELFYEFMKKAEISHNNRIAKKHRFYYIYNCDVNVIESAEEIMDLLAEDYKIYTPEFAENFMTLRRKNIC